MDLFESMLADIIDEARLGRGETDALAMKLAREYREQFRVALARDFKEREPAK